MKSAATRWMPPGIGLTAFVLYILTGARTIQWQDSAQFTYRVTRGIWENDYGLAMVHPLHFGLGRLSAWLFPDQIPWALSGVSALGGALAVGGVAAVLLRETRSSVAAGYGAGVLMLAHTFWRFSGLPEVYTLSAALLVLEVAWFLRMPPQARGVAWGGLFLVNGLALANHNLAMLSLPVWGICWILRCRAGAASFKDLGWIAGGWIVGSSPFWALILLEIQAGGEVGPVLHSALFGYSFQEQVTGLLPDLRILGISAGFLILSFPVIPWVLAVQGARRHLRGWTPVLALAMIHLLFFLRYNVIDQYTFFIPVMALLALFAGLGMAEVSSPRIRRMCIGLLLLQPLGYAVMPGVVRASGVMTSLERHKPYRDDYRYLFWPWMVTETSADRLAEDASGSAGPGMGLVAVEDPMAYYAVAWKLNWRGHASRVITGRDPEQEGIKVWVPARTDTPVPAGWKKQDEVWIRDRSTLDSSGAEE